jgi:SAM-dependent methyltransferase
MSEVIWNDVECGGYEADLPLWEQLAAENEGPILELGCGTGRVVMHLARSTEKLVIGVDNDDALVAALWERARGTSGDAEIGDVRGFDLHFEFQLVLAPMQLVQLLDGRADRICCLSCVADHLLPGGRAAFAIVDRMPASLPEAGPQLPDVRQLDGWVYSSLPLEPVFREGSILLRRLRQVVSPDGDLSEEENEVVLQVLSAEQFEEEAREMGFRPIGRREIPATDAHVGATVVVLEVD